MILIIYNYTKDVNTFDTIDSKTFFNLERTRLNVEHRVEEITSFNMLTKKYKVLSSIKTISTILNFNKIKLCKLFPQKTLFLFLSVLFYYGC